MKTFDAVSIGEQFLDFEGEKFIRIQEIEFTDIFKSRVVFNSVFLSSCYAGQLYFFHPSSKCY